MTFGGISFLVAYVHTCYVVKEVFNKIFPQENIGVWGTLPVNCERRACLGGVLGICDFHNTQKTKLQAARYVY